MKITRDIALKVRETVAAGLVQGRGRPEPGRMCVEAAVCYAMGLPHSDRPTCVSPAIQSLNIALNDKPWSSPDARAKGLARLALVQLGSAGAVDDCEFSRRVAEMTIRVVVPLAFRAVSQCHPRHSEALTEAALECEREGTHASAISAANAANAADSDAAYAAVRAAVRAAAYAEQAEAADAAFAEADAAAYAAETAAAYAAAHTRDRVLADFAERVVQILVEMGAPGAQWLDLSPLVEVRP